MEKENENDNNKNQTYNNNHEDNSNNTDDKLHRYNLELLEIPYTKFTREWNTQTDISRHKQSVLYNASAQGPIH